MLSPHSDSSCKVQWHDHSYSFSAMFPSFISSFSLFLAYVSLFAGLTFHNSVASPIYVYSLCSDMTTLAHDSKYLTNLDTLLSSLLSNTTNKNRYYNTTSGSGANKVYGIFFCLIDLTTTACHECISLAITEVRVSCSRKKASIVWYDRCMLRYSNVSFFGTMESAPMLPLWNRPDAQDMWTVMNNQTAFMQGLVDTLGDAANHAANSLSGKKYATKEANFVANLTKLSTLYTLTECTPDISIDDCKICLQMSIHNVSDLCNRKAGCTLMCPSCNLRFEVYPFYGDGASTFNFGGTSSKQPTRRIVAIIVGITVTVSLAVALLFGAWICIHKRNSEKEVNNEAETDGIEIIESMKFDFNTIWKATNNFSSDNKLGEGGFGEVYKGQLDNGQYIAVKRLSRNSKQGISEFKTEVLIVAKLQHRSLVKLLGFCLAEEEKILIYEFLPNLSLDQFLSDPVKHASLNWKTRFKVISGIARGLLYLHEDSRLKIVHRDLKLSNILLDEDMNPKIADFGMAKLFGVDQTQDNTTRIVGTFGYMAPEYLLAGQFSVKSDVYSFGIIVLEIVSGERNNHLSRKHKDESLMHRAWRLWGEGTPLKLADSTTGSDGILRDPDEVKKCIHIGLLCVQEDAARRPQIASIVASLNGEAIALPSPTMPRFLAGTVEEHCSGQCTGIFSGVNDITELCP